MRGCVMGRGAGEGRGGGGGGVFGAFAFLWRAGPCPRSNRRPTRYVASAARLHCVATRKWGHTDTALFGPARTTGVDPLLSGGFSARRSGTRLCSPPPPSTHPPGSCFEIARNFNNQKFSSLYCPSAFSTRAAAFVTRMPSCSARSIRLLRLRWLTLPAISAQNLRLCISSTSSSFKLDTTTLRNPLGSTWRVFLLVP
jgi:hypothetical protein